MAGGEDVKARMNLALQEKERQARLELLHKDITRKIDFLIKKSAVEHHDVYLLIKEFFREFLDRRYEFTVNELRAELKQVYISHVTRQHIGHVLSAIEAIEYTNVHYTRADLVKILEQLREVVTQLVHVHTHNATLFDRLRIAFGGKIEPEQLIAELPAIEGNDGATQRLYTLVEKCYIALDHHDLHRAKAAYQALLTEYNQLDNAQRAKHYHVLHQTYLDLASRAKMEK